MFEAYTFEGRAMGTDYGIEIVCNGKAQAEALARKAISEIESAEKRFSRFIEESELSQLNRERRMEVSSAFLAVLEHAYDLFLRTHGIFNPLVQVQRLGYDRSFELLSNTDSEATDEPYNVDFTTTNIGHESHIVELQEGQMLDFGGFLKGYLAQILAMRITGDGPHVRGAVVNIGGDLHASGTDADGAPFAFCVHNPLAPDPAAMYHLSDASLATSGTYKRRWHASGSERNHIIVANGRDNPTSGIISASVVHACGGCAEAFAKVFLIAGERAAREILSQERMRYTLISKDGTITAAAL